MYKYLYASAFLAAVGLAAFLDMPAESAQGAPSYWPQQRRQANDFIARKTTPRMSVASVPDFLLEAGKAQCRIWAQ